MSKSKPEVAEKNPIGRPRVRPAGHVKPIQTHVTEAEHASIRTASVISGQTTTEFARVTLIAAAERVIAEFRKKKVAS